MSGRSLALAVAFAAAGCFAQCATLWDGWRFLRDDEGKLDASADGFDDSAWARVRVPHDWAISGPFDRTPGVKGGSGKLPWKGVGWYRRALDIPAARFDASGSYRGAAYLTFDGVMARPQVWINGKLAGGWDYGYLGFTLEVAKLFRPGANAIAVKADTRDHRSRWYPGAGIYRKVTFVEKPAEHVVPGSVFVTTPEVTADHATVRVACEWAKAGPSNFTFTVKNPHRWDVDDPFLYELELDGETYRYGIRSFRFTPDDGFHLNGRRVQLKGVDLHSDLGLLGMAFDKSAARRQLTLMKDMGANALRTSHNPPAPEMLDLCDELGFVVWDECFDKWDGTAGRRGNENLEAYVTHNLQAFARRDRNHPSVVVWSMGNEIMCGDENNPANPGLTRDRCRFFREMMRLVDPTRPIGVGNISNLAAKNILDREIFADLDITGWNYCGSYAGPHAKYPDRPVVYSESASALSTYGFYLPDLPNGIQDHAKKLAQCTSYDGLGIDIPDAEFARMERDRYCAGEFVWIGIDYLGEPHPFWTEARSSYFGAVDLVGVKKDRFYLYRSHWNKSARTLHVLPHWNWEAFAPGSTKPLNVPVFVYTDAEEAELFVNGRSQGRRRKGGGFDSDLPPNKAAGGKVSACTSEGQNPPCGMLDGDGGTRWCASSAAVPAWAQVELPAETSFRHVGLSFEFSYPMYAFDIEVSSDGTTWRRVFSKKLGENTRPVFEQPVAARFVRVVVTEVKNNLFPSIRELRLDDDVKEPRNGYYAVCAKYRLMWFDTVYEPGELKVTAIRDGLPAESVVVRTAGASAALKATVEPLFGKDPDELIWVQIDAFDAQGVRQPLANNLVHFKLEGPGEIVGVGNGNPLAMESFTAVGSHPLFNGKAVAVVRRTGRGRLVLTAASDGLRCDSVELP